MTLRFNSGDIYEKTFISIHFLSYIIITPAVLIDNEATLKRVYKYENKIVLQPENPKYEPLVFVGEELNQIRIIGKAVSFTSMIK